MRQFDRDMQDELQAHIEHRADDLVKSGLTREEALRRARVEFGAIEAYKEQLRDERRFAPVTTFLETAGRDLRLAFRRLRKAPLFALFAIASLAMGLGVTTAAYSLIQAVVWPQIGISETERLAFVATRTTSPSWRSILSAADFAELRRQQTSFASFAGSASGYHYITDASIAIGARSEAVTGTYFQTLGVNAALGRTLVVADDEPGAPAVMVISDYLWRAKLHSDPHVIGRIVHTAGRPIEIVGVMPRAFGGLARLSGGRRTDVWVSWNTAPIVDELVTVKIVGSNRVEVPTSTVAAQRITAIGRIRPERPVETVSAEIATAATRLNESSPRYSSTPDGSRILPRAWMALTFDDVRRRSVEEAVPVGSAIVALFALVLLVACTNLANLTLARGVARQTELMVRRALGASRARLVRELTVESLLIGFAGSVAALLTARWLIWLIANEISLFGTTLAEAFDPGLNLSVYGFAAAAVMFALLVFGLMPAIRLTRGERTNPVARDSAGGGTRWRGQRHLIRVQVSISMLLFLVAAFCVAVVVRGTRQETGLDLDHIVIADVGFARQFRDQARAAAATEAVLQQLASDSAFERAAVTTGLPSVSATFGRVAPENRPELLDSSEQSYVVASSSAGLIETLGVPILRGRSIDARDTADAPPVAVVTESLARKLFGTTDAVGRRVLIETIIRSLSRTSPTIAGKLGSMSVATPTSITTVGDPTASRTATIIGIARDTSIEWGRPDGGVVYVPWVQQYDTPTRIVARRAAGLDGDAAVLALRNAVRRAVPDLAVTSSGTGEQVLAPERAVMRVLTVLATGLGIFALTLTMIGLYGVLSHVVVRRTRELCLRLALGATPRQLLRLVMRDGLRPVLSGIVVGIVLGIPARIAAHDALDEYLPIEPFLFLGVATAFVVCGIAACYWPARRARNVDPNVALKEL